MTGSEMMTLEAACGKWCQLLDMVTRNGARDVGVFGSATPSEAGDSSNLDMLVNLESGRSLIELGSLLTGLEAELGSRVDLVTEAGLRPALHGRILGEAVPL